MNDDIDKYVEQLQAEFGNPFTVWHRTGKDAWARAIEMFTHCGWRPPLPVRDHEWGPTTTRGDHATVTRSCLKCTRSETMLRELHPQWPTDDHHCTGKGWNG